MLNKSVDTTRVNAAPFTSSKTLKTFNRNGAVASTLAYHFGVRQRKRMRIHHQKTFILALTFTGLTIASNFVYRPLISRHELNDYGLSHVLPSALGTVVLVLLAWSLSELPKAAIKNAVSVILGSMLYEIIQPYVGTGVFDINDLIAIATVGSISIGMLWIYQSVKRNKVYKTT